MLIYVSHIIYVTICLTKALYFEMDKKAFISFRATKDDEDFLKKVGELDDRSVSSVLVKMIRYFRSKGDAKKTIRELNK